MNHHQAAEVLRDWIVAIAAADNDLEEIPLERTYTAPVDTRQAATPNAAAVTRRVLKRDSDPRFRQVAIMQRRLRIFELEASVMVDAGETEDSIEALHKQLTSYGSALEASIDRADRLAGALPEGVHVGEEAIFQYLEVVDEFEGGLTGRLLVIELALGEAVPE